MTFKDRTNEFHSVVERIKNRSQLSSSTLERRALLSSSQFSPKPSTQQLHHPRSEFSLMASEISRNITGTASKLEKLTKLAKRKTLFDDKPVEISELTFIIKQDIAKLNKQIAMLQSYTKSHKTSNKQVTEHTSNVVVALQSKLADTSMSFKDVLEIRTENMKMTKDKRDQFLFTTADQLTGESLANSPLVKSRRRSGEEKRSQQQQPSPRSDNLHTTSNLQPIDEQESTLSLGIPMISQQQIQEQQQLAVMEQDRYIENRSTAIESIESTIAELGGIFQQLATMVAEQRETVQRIDQNTDDIEMNVVGAQRELLKYYTNISSNRWLIIKVFATTCMADSDRQEQGWSSINSRRDRAGEATRMFITHVRHYLASIPLISLGVIIIPIVANLLDIITLIGPTHNMNLVDWLHLSVTKIINHFQVHNNTTLLLTNLILLVPYVSIQERKKGSICVLFELVVLYTILPGVVYLVFSTLLTTAAHMSGMYLGNASFSGLSVWTVGLSMWAMLDGQAQGNPPNHSLFGVIPLPPKAIPFLIMGFYLFLVPDSSLIIHLAAAGIAYLYFHHRLPSVLTPTTEKYRQYENHRLVRLLSGHPKFISVDNAGDGYLPVSSTASATPYTVNTQPSSSGSPSNFPGQGFIGLGYSIEHVLSIGTTTSSCVAFKALGIWYRFGWVAPAANGIFCGFDWRNQMKDSDDETYENQTSITEQGTHSNQGLYQWHNQHHLVGSNKHYTKMATKRTPHTDLKEEGPVIDEAIERGWEIPDFTIKEIRDAIPAHCFRRDTIRSFTYVIHDVAIILALGYAATFIDHLPSVTARIALWPLYWIAQGIVGTGVWVIGHECGHQAFSPSKAINNGVGMVLHSLLLVPYHSWRFSHSRHHKATGHMTKDQVFVPYTRKAIGLPTRDVDPEGDGPHSSLEETPIAMLYRMTMMFVFGWPMYLFTNVTSQPYPGWASHFNPYCNIFDSNQVSDVYQSILGIFTTIGLLTCAGQVFGSLAVIKFYVIPYLFVNFWLVLITYLQHTDPDMPHYRENVWNFQRGAALTVDRSYGFLLNYFHHHISDTHVAHHFFSTMPHYHAEEATVHIKKALGKHYRYDPTPIPQALYNSWKTCRFVEDDGDVVFFKN